MDLLQQRIEATRDVRDLEGLLDRAGRRMSWLSDELRGAKILVEPEEGAVWYRDIHPNLRWTDETGPKVGTYHAISSHYYLLENRREQHLPGDFLSLATDEGLYVIALADIFRCGVRELQQA